MFEPNATPLQKDEGGRGGAIDRWLDFLTGFGIMGIPLMTASTSAVKEIDYVHPHYRALIDASPFLTMATSGADGFDVSPRGDAAGLVVVQDGKTLLLPERQGNKRADSQQRATLY